jgi:hypothetical protein
MIKGDLHNRAFFEFEVDRICGLVAETLVKKNRDYGSSIFDSPKFAPDLDPGIAIRVRRSDKEARKQELLTRAGKPDVDESINDTQLDIIAYDVLEWLQMMYGEPARPAKEDDSNA